MKTQGYGLPLRCPKCPPESFFGMLKVPGNKAVPCPNCGTPLISMKKYSAVIRPLQEEPHERD
jgi:ssDNA-binding Zn-finger/Zn-ribbon topoisomerase 1